VKPNRNIDNIVDTTMAIDVAKPEYNYINII